jgi:hypothetical protein
MTTTPLLFWPKVRPSGLSTSASIVFEAPAVFAVISSLLVAMEKEPFFCHLRRILKYPFWLHEVKGLAKMFSGMKE